MKKEYKYFSVIVLLFSFSTLTLILLLNRYFYLTLQHFLDTCQQITNSFLISLTHYIGLFLLITTALTVIILVLKTMLSLIKTRNKLKELLTHSIDQTSKKLKRALLNTKVSRKKVMVIETNFDYAVSYGILSHKIVISTALINKLTLNELEAVLLHEKYHLQNNHQFLLIVSEILSSALFFIPIAKEFTRKMRVVFENQADIFTIQNQNTDDYLKLALSKVSANSLKQYPGFAHRRNHTFSKTNIIISFSVVILIIALFLLPVESHAIEQTGQNGSSRICRENQCSTHCKDKMSQEPAFGKTRP